MSKVIILTDRNNKLKYEQNKKMLFKSRLEMKSSHSKNIVPLSISNITSNKIKKTLKMKDNQKSSNKNEKINAYTHKKNLVYINGNNNIFRDEKNIYPKILIQLLIILQKILIRIIYLETHIQKKKPVKIITVIKHL